MSMRGLPLAAAGAGALAAAATAAATESVPLNQQGVLTFDSVRILSHASRWQWLQDADNLSHRSGRLVLPAARFVASAQHLLYRIRLMSHRFVGCPPSELWPGRSSPK
jgi:hypothetical protein